MPDASSQKSSRTALLIRKGAKFTCHADGLCCSSIHLLGPVAGKELIDVRRLSRKAVTYEHDYRSYMMTLKDNACMFLRPDNLCGVHAEIGVDKKPATCRKFPFALTATPIGRRVTTAHRCPCRTIGEGAPLTPEGVDKEIRIDGQVLRSERTVFGKVTLSPGKSVAFSTYLQIEARFIDRLLAGEDAMKVLGQKPWRELRGATSWEDVAADMHEPADDSYYSIMRLWIGDAILNAVEGKRFPKRERPWARFYENSKRRSPKIRDPKVIINDWLADDFWSMDWMDNGNLERALRDWATRVDIIRRISKHMIKQGVRRDSATAEASMMVDAVCTCEDWDEVAKGLKG